jgi:thiol-disulfide isomerase/thioredoxin
MKHITNQIIILSIAIISFSCNQKHNLTAEIEGLENDTILIEYMPLSLLYQMDEPLQDTIVSSNNKFVYDSPSDEPIFAIMFPQNAGFKRLDGSPYLPRHKYLNILLKPEDKISIKGKLHKYYVEYETVGSVFNDEFSQLRKEYIQETSEAAKIELVLDTLISEKGDKEEINKLFRMRNEINGIERTKQFEYAKDNWDKDLSAYFLSQQSLDTIAKYYENLDANVRNGNFKEVLDYKLLNHKKYTKIREAEQNIIVGKIAPDFSLMSISGKDLNLASINDKIIILDFWGSWCGWCIKGFPKMKDYYSKYKSQIEIIGIACNDTEEKWKNSVKENNLDWLHVINDSDIDKDVSLIFGIQSYPTKIILDKDKTIIAKFVGESDDFYNKIDELIKNYSR